MKNILKRIHRFLSQFFFDPLVMLNKWKALPYYFRNMLTYSRLSKGSPFKITASKLYYTTGDMFQKAGSMKSHYFHQDLWGARLIRERGLQNHIDVGSRLDGFVAHVLSFCKVSYVDIREMESAVDGLEFIKGSITNLPFEDNSVSSLSCLHVLEHIGLGRYGDEIDAEGPVKGAKELSRVLEPGGRLYFWTPVGRQALYFDAHRVFDPQTVLDMFSGLRLLSYTLIGDKAEKTEEDPGYIKTRQCNYGCGLFVFTKENPL